MSWNLNASSAPPSWADSQRRVEWQTFASSVFKGCAGQERSNPADYRDGRAPSLFAVIVPTQTCSSGIKLCQAFHAKITQPPVRVGFRAILASTSPFIAITLHMNRTIEAHRRIQIHDVTEAHFTL